MKITSSAILAGILLLSASPANAGTITYRLPCPPPVPNSATIDGCVGGSPPPSGDGQLNFTVASAGGVVTDSIQGTMSFSLIPGNDLVDIYTRQTIAPGPGEVNFGNHYTIYVWADQPLSGVLRWTNTSSCSFFFPGGDCMGAAANVLIIPYLGDNPDLANAAQMSGFVGDGVFRPPDITLPPGNWENLIDLGFDGGTMRNHIQVVVSIDATFQNGEMVPEPATQSQVGLAFAFFLVIAYRQRKIFDTKLSD